MFIAQSFAPGLILFSARPLVTTSAALCFAPLIDVAETVIGHLTLHFSLLVIVIHWRSTSYAMLHLVLYPTQGLCPLDGRSPTHANRLLAVCAHRPIDLGHSRRWVYLSVEVSALFLCTLHTAHCTLHTDCTLPVRSTVYCTVCSCSCSCSYSELKTCVATRQGGPPVQYVPPTTWPCLLPRGAFR